ncbi:MAG: phospholipase D-like domain-containing protein, partial [Myxococcales bacterium]
MARASPTSHPTSAPAFAPPGLAYVERPGELIAGNAVRLLVGGDQAYPAMLEAIQQATGSIWLEVYIFADDWVGRLFADALAARAQAGVDVRVCVDGLGGALSAGTLLDGLRVRGVQVVDVFDLKARQRAWRWFRRDHRKLLIVDHRIAFTGGLNLGLDYAGPRYGGGGWYDLQLEVRGPAVRALARHFVKTWRTHGGRRIDEPPSQPPAGNDAVRVLANHLSATRKEIQHA